MAGIAAALFFPEASYVLVVPAIVAGLLGLSGVTFVNLSACSR